MYGLEQALTPVILLYRADIWEAAGFDPNTFETWDDYIAAAETLKSDTVFPLPVAWGPETLEILTHQRNADYFDADGNVTLDSQPVIDTMNWILDMIDAGIMDVPTGDLWADFTSGKYISHISADWGTGSLRDLAPDLSGKWKAAPLPAVEPGLPRTSVYGGTGAVIVATSPNVDAAWKFLEYAYLTVDPTISRAEKAGLYPAFLPAMSDPRLAESSSEYYSGQNLNALYAELAPEVPAQYQSPYRTELKSLLATAWQDIIDRNRTPEEVFAEISEEIRATMAEEMES
jgi:ABC-type glycerol-3-phosphate transport system substrate-binding protein